MIEIKNLSVFYRHFSAIKDISFLFKKGHIYGITGPNGAGKSTLLNAIAGIIPYRGSITINGVEVKGMKYKERVKFVGYLPHRELLPYGFTLLDMILMGTYKKYKSVYGPSSKDKEKARKYLKYFEIEHLSNKKIEELSEGEFTLGRICRVFIHGSQFMLFDEVFSSLDIRHIVLVMKLMKKLLEKDRTVIMVSHDLNLIAQYSDYVVIFKDGKIVFDGTPQSVLKEGNLADVYDVGLHVVKNPESEKPGIFYP